VTGKDVNPGSESSHLYKVDGEVHTTVLLDREGKYVRHLTEGKPMFGDGLHKALVPVKGFDLTNPPVGQKLENTVAYDDSRSPLRYTAGADDGVKQYMENLEAYADAIKPEGGITLGTTPDVSAPEAVSKAAFPDLPDHQVAPEPAPQRAGRERAAPSVREPSREWPEILSPEQAPMRAPEVEKAEIPDASKDPVAALEAISKHLDDGKSLYGDDIGKIATTGDQAFRNDVALFAQEHRRNPDLTAQEYFDAKNAPKAAPEPVKPAAPSRTESTRQIDLPADMAIKGQGHYMNPTDAANIIRRDLNAGLAEYGAGMNTTKGRIHGLEEAAGDVKSLFPDAVDQNGRIDGGKLPEAVRDALGESGMDMIDDVNKGLDRLKPIEPDIAPQRGMESAPLLTPQ
jgi:hypothetical protein